MVPRRKNRPRPAGELSPRLAEFERLYRAEFGAVAAYFARRCEDPQLVADLTADTFVAAIHSFAEYDPGANGTRAWTIGIARRVYTALSRVRSPRGAGRAQLRAAAARPRRDQGADVVDRRRAIQPRADGAARTDVGA